MARRQGRRFRWRERRFDLKRSLFLLPNLITLSSVFCGFYSIVVSSHAQSEDEFYRSALLIVFAMFFDMLDGRVARMTKTQSSFGLQIDSLADIVCFGVAPAALIHSWSLHLLGTAGLLACFAFVAAGAIRLARFNVLSMDQSGAPNKPGKYIVGLPIPGAAGILVSIVVASSALRGTIDGSAYPALFDRSGPKGPAVILGVMLLLATLMVSTVRFRSFKDLKLNARSVALVTFAVGTSALIATQLEAAFVLVWLLGFYVLLGIFEWLWRIPGRIRGTRRDSQAPTEPAPTPRTSEPPE